MSRSEQSRVAGRGRAFALIVAAAFAGACGDDGDDDKQPVDSGNPTDAATRNDAGRDAGNGMDAATDAGRDAGVDAGRDAGPRDSGPLATAGEDAPTISKAGYYSDELGRRILIAASDKNGDIKSYTISYFSDLAGTTAVAVDDDGDSSTPATATSRTTDVQQNATYADLLIKFVPASTFTDIVKSIKVKVTDAGGRSSAESAVIKLEQAPQTGSQCDPNGFNRCSGNNICTPNANNDNYSCATVVNARQAACANNAPLTLAPVAGTPAMVTAPVNNSSFWDAPTGCVGGDTMTGFPDRVVKVTLAAQAAKLRLSTGGAASEFDSAIYVIPNSTPACKDGPMACLEVENGCNNICADGALGDLVLTNAAAGDHYIVVDRFPSSTTDTFTLTATIE